MGEPIRVLHVLQRMEAGGTQALLMNIYRNIDKNKIQFDFLVEYKEKEFYDDEIISMGGKIYYTDVRKTKNIFGFQKTLRKIIEKNNYNIIHVHTYSIGYFVLKEAKNRGVPVRIAHSHSNNMTKDIKQFIKLIMQKLYILYATDYMACSKEAGEYLFKNKEYSILPNAIDSKKFIYSSAIREKVRHELNLNNCFVVGHVGRFKREKNHMHLLSIFEKILSYNNTAKLLIIGNGQLENDIKNKVKEMNLSDKVIILKNRSDVNELLQAMDVFVFPSLYEGLGIVAIESQAAGTPIIISDGVPDEAMISPLCKKISLKSSVEEWAKAAIDISNNKLAHTNMQKYIVENNFDLKNTTKWIEDYYLKKNKEFENVK